MSGTLRQGSAVRKGNRRHIAGQLPEKVRTMGKQSKFSM